MKHLSEARLAANRANAQKSTGPRTPEGKRRVSQNALKHGLTARIHQPPPPKPSDLAPIRTILLSSFHPATPEELALIDLLALLQARLDHCSQIEASLFEGVSNSNTALATAFIQHQGTFNTLSRCQAHFSRAYDRTLKQLLAVRTQVNLRKQTQIPLKIKDRLAARTHPNPPKPSVSPTIGVHLRPSAAICFTAPRLSAASP